MSHEADVRYRINERDEIIFVNEAWDRFAQANDGAETVGNKVLGRILWDFIPDGTTRKLYQQIVALARQGYHPLFKLRCDSPSCKRHLEMTIHAIGTGIIEFATWSLQLEDRAPIALLARGTPRSAQFLRICAWCNRIDIGFDEWVEAEVAVERLKLFEVERMPQSSHGICAACYATMTSTLDNLKLSP
ncbi:MAG: hypothetical protein ACI8PT_001208 [Gammaproteobacteria bacterium]|jgi:hypothetical protein